MLSVLLFLIITMCKGSFDMDVYYNSNTQFYNCNWCNRKYKTEKKFKQHVEQHHPFATLNSNWKTLSDVETKYILTQLKIYSNVIKDIALNNVKDTVSHLLMPTIDIISTNELDRITKNHKVFCQRVVESGLLEKVFSDSKQLESVLKDFQRFLNLGQPWIGGNFCPTLTIDLLWHASMMSNEEYKILTNRFLGTVLPHCLNENEDKHEERYNNFEKHFIHYHKQQPLKIDMLNIGKEDAITVLFDKLKQKEYEEQERETKRQRERELRRIEAEKRYKDMVLKEEQRRNDYYAKYGSYPRSIWDDGKC